MKRFLRSKSFTVMICGALITFGVLARVYHVGSKPLSHDEIYTLLQLTGFTDSELNSLLYKQGERSAGEFQEQFLDPRRRTFSRLLAHLQEKDPGHGVVFFAIAQQSLNLFSQPIVPMRYPAVLFGLLSIPAAGLLAGALFHSQRAAFFCAAWTACSPQLVVAAQDARPYSLWGLLIILSTHALVRAIDRGLFRYWGAYSILTALAFNTHFLHLSVFVAQALILVLLLPEQNTERAGARRRQTEGRLRSLGLFAGASLIALTAALPSALNLIHHFSTVRTVNAWSAEKLDAGLYFKALLATIGRANVDFNAPDAPTGLTAAAIIVSALLTLAVLSYLASEIPSRGKRAVLLLAGAPFLALAAVDFFRGGHLVSVVRYAMPLYLALALILGRLSAGLTSTRLNRPLLFTLILLGGANCASSAAYIKADYWRSRWLNQEIYESAGSLSTADSANTFYVYPRVGGDREVLLIGTALSAPAQVILIPADTPPERVFGEGRVFLLGKIGIPIREQLEPPAGFL